MEWPHIRTIGVALAALLALFALAGCGSSDSGGTSGGTSTDTASSETSTAPGGSAPIKLTIKTLSFHPRALSARVGQTVQWTNLDGPLHNVTYVSGPEFKPSKNLKTGQKFTLKLTAAGTIRYVCTIHPFMKATLIVRGQ
jgi:plastocyanin